MKTFLSIIGCFLLAITIVSAQKVEINLLTN